MKSILFALNIGHRFRYGHYGLYKCRSLTIRREYDVTYERTEVYISYICFKQTILNRQIQ